jgi:hypothetical protein
MFNVILVGVLAIGYEDLPVVDFDKSSNVVIVKDTSSRSIVLRRRALVDLPVATINKSVTIVSKATNRVRNIVTDQPILPRVNSVIKNIVIPKKAEGFSEVKVTTSTSTDGLVKSNITTFNTEVIYDQKKRIVGRNRFRIFK